MPVISSELQGFDNAFEQEIYESLIQVLNRQPDPYVVCGNCNISLHDQGSLETDGIVISPYGVFTIEAKNYRGKVERGENTPLSIRDQWGKPISVPSNKNFYTQASKQAKQLKSFFEELGASGVVTKSLLVFPNGNSFDVPNRDRDYRGITDVYVGTIDEIPNVVRSFHPSGQTYLSKQIQQVLLKAIRDGAGKLTSAERNLLSSLKKANGEEPRPEPRKPSRPAQPENRPQYQPRSTRRTGCGGSCLKWGAGLTLAVFLIILCCWVSIIASWFTEFNLLSTPSGGARQEEPAQAPGSLWQAPGLDNSPSGQALQLEGCVTVSALNVRTGPSADYRITGSLEKGECTLFSGRNEKGSWGKTSTGWVALNYIQMDGEVMDLPIDKP